MIKISSLNKTYYSHNTAVVALDDINLELPSGSVTLLNGPSGCGKTTLLNIIGGMLTPTSGHVLVNDKDIVSLPQNFLSQYRRDQREHLVL